jgi:hypothetical protein
LFLSKHYEGDSREDRENNARYVISVARMFGCTIFLTVEDIMEVKKKMIFTLVAAIKYISE